MQQYFDMMVLDKEPLINSLDTQFLVKYTTWNESELWAMFDLCIVGYV